MITVQDLSKTFRIPHAKKKTLFHNLLSLTASGYDYEEFFALQKISFEVKAGESIGLIGRNGSGKSTLLKILARIYQPTTGTVKMGGEVYPMLELGVGFQADFSVRDNIFIYGALIGFSRKEMQARFEAIVRFAELERFADARLEKLSTGMQMRLGFALATQAVAPIMLVDEVLAVGDSIFIEKCRSTFRRFRENGVTLVLVSHDREAIKEYCDRVIVLEQGKVVFMGHPEDAERYYAEEVIKTKQ